MRLIVAVQYKIVNIAQVIDDTKFYAEEAKEKLKNNNRHSISGSFFLFLLFWCSEVVVKSQLYLFKMIKFFWAKKVVIWWLFSDDLRAIEQIAYLQKNNISKSQWNPRNFCRFSKRLWCPASCERKNKPEILCLRQTSLNDFFTPK